MAEYEKLLPEGVPAWQMPYWDGLKESKILVQECSGCGTLRHIPKELCPSCYSTHYEWHQITGEGEVFTYTVVHRAPTPAFQADGPYVIAHVQMDDGVRMIADLRADPETVRTGLPVQAVFDSVTPEWTLLRFEPR